MIKNANGQSIIQVMMAVGISGIVLTAIATMQVNQQREAQALFEKIASAEVARSISSSLAKPDEFCNGMFAPGNFVNSSDHTFSSASFPKKIAFKSIPMTNLNVGAPASALSATLKLASGNATSPGIQLVVNSATQATLELNYDASSVVRGLRPLQFPNIPIVTSGPAAALKIDGCGTGPAGGGGGGGGGPVWTNVGSWWGPGTEFFNVSFTPKSAGKWVNIRVDIPVVGGQGGWADLVLELDGTDVAHSFMQFANVAGHSGPMAVTHWFQPASTAAVNIRVYMAGNNGRVNEAPITVANPRPVVLAVTEL